MLSKKERKWKKKFEKTFSFDRSLFDDPYYKELGKLYSKQSDEIRRDIKRIIMDAWDNRENGNWQEDMAAAFQLMGLEVRFVTKKKNK